ncbi:MAG: hypothetical protein GTO18_21200 [Anaerolineales bacterium]|nr:hypothetical protein [Anaerolineales bacterium]
MAKVTRSIVIDAPVEKVFEYHTDPTNNPEYWPSFQAVMDIEENPAGGKNFGWTYKMVGIKLEGTTKTVEYIPNERWVTKTEGGVESTFTYTYEPEGDGTKLSMEVDYSIPVPVVGKLAESVVIKTNEREADTVLGNLKDILEA